MVYWFAGGH